MENQLNYSEPRGKRLTRTAETTVTRGALALAFILALLATAAPSGQAQTETILYAFTAGADGSNPTAGLAWGVQGKVLFGTTYAGGPFFSGTVFRVTPGGKEKVLYSFKGGTDGVAPYAGLVVDAVGNLYGTTSEGGASGHGTVFRVTVPAGKEKVLYSFKGGIAGDGDFPYAGLVRDAKGNLYGTTVNGPSGGTIFKITPAGKETILSNGGSFGGLILDAKGNLYGTTADSGNFGVGTVFKLTPARKLTVLYNFQGGTDGAAPFASLVRDAKGNLYGTTTAGGTFNAGTVFKLTPNGKETVLHTFRGGKDGEIPYAGLVQDGSGNLFGTTYSGGAFGYGTVFRVTPTGNEKVLHSFNQYPDGANPFAGVILDANGNLYGTTYVGGPTSGLGVVFKLVP